MNGKHLIAAGAANGFLAVALGAFGAHGLRHVLEAGQLATYETGVEYQGLHALALLATGVLCHCRGCSRWLLVAGWAFLLGTLLFSGSLYALSLTGTRAWALATPFGGLGMLAGWCCLGIGAYRTP